MQADEDLCSITHGVSMDPYKRGRKLTYLQSGRRVKDQTIALTPPMISSLGGTGPDGDQIPFSTYKGEVPMSEYMIPIRGAVVTVGITTTTGRDESVPSVWKLSMASAKPDTRTGRRFELKPEEPAEDVDI